MATRLSVPKYDFDKMFCLVVYSGLLSTDVGEAFDSAPYTLMSVQWQGTPGVGFDGDIQGNNEVTPVNWADIAAFSNATASGLIIPAAGTIAYPVATRWMRPNVKAGDGTTNMVCSMFFRRLM
jgi:hypothetical protein